MTRMLESMLTQLRPAVQVRLFVPSRDSSGRLLPLPGLASIVTERLSAITGGATTFAGRGMWIGRSRVVRERVQVVETYFGDEVTPSQRLRFRRLIEMLVREANQAVIAIAIGGRLFLIPGRRETRRARAVESSVRRSSK